MISILTVVILSLFFIFSYKISIKKFKSAYKENENISSKKTAHYLKLNTPYFGYYVSALSILPAIAVGIFTLLFSKHFLKNHIYNNLTEYSSLLKDHIFSTVVSVSENISFYSNIENIPTIRGISPESILQLAVEYNFYNQLSVIAFALSLIITCLTFFLLLIRFINFESNFQAKVDKIIKNILLFFTTIALLTTIGIILSLLFESFRFFQMVSFIDFFLGVKWTPETYAFEPDNSFGLIPLVTGTFLISFIAMLTSVSIGIFAAIYMSEYMPKHLRKIFKPMIEALSGIPSIVYGFFAALTFGPFIVDTLAVFNIPASAQSALNAGIIMGVMIVPFVASITDDLLASLPNHLREGSLSLGSMKHEMISYVLVPAALPGIIGGILLGVSRAIGETMIVVMASSLSANLTLNPVEPVTTITTQIAMLVKGDQEFNSPKTLSAFALGLTLLLLTLVLNLLALRIVNKYKKQYD